MSRRRKGGHGGGHHGGSWKVAYADFVTAMMAFFLLMWLLNMTATDQKANLAKYFKEFSIFESGSLWDLNVAPTPSMTPESKVSLQITDSEAGESPPAGGPEAQAQAARQQEVLDLLQREVESRLVTMQDQIIIDTFDGGVRVQVVDQAGGSLFPVGGVQLSGDGRRALSVLAQSLRGLGQKVAVEGHTDALGYAGSRYTNWELSTERASVARKTLEEAGLNPDCLLRVAGYAATQPLIPTQPNDPRNRRISILVFNRQPCAGIPQPTGLPAMVPPPVGGPSNLGIGPPPGNP